MKEREGSRRSGARILEGEAEQVDGLLFPEVGTLAGERKQIFYGLGLGGTRRFMRVLKITFGASKQIWSLFIHSFQFCFICLHSN